MSRFSNIVENRKNESVTGKIISDGNELSEIMHGIDIEYVSVKDPLNLHRATSNETAFASEIPNIINEENVIISPGQGKNQFQF